MDGLVLLLIAELEREHGAAEVAVDRLRQAAIAFRESGCPERACECDALADLGEVMDVDGAIAC